MQMKAMWMLFVCCCTCTCAAPPGSCHFFYRGTFTSLTLHSSATRVISSSLLVQLSVSLPAARSRLDRSSTHPKPPSSLLDSPPHHTNPNNQHQPSLSGRAKAHTALRSWRLALPYSSRPPYLPYNSKLSPTLFSHSFSFNTTVKGKYPLFWSPIPAVGVPLLWPAPLRCKASHSPLLLFSSGISASLALESRFGVKGIYHGAAFVSSIISLFFSSIFRDSI